MENNHLNLRGYQAFTRLSRLISQLMRKQLSQGPITMQQCYTLEALITGPKAMTVLASEVALHQSTLTRIVEKLEKQGLVIRTRKPKNQRMVEVSITEKGEDVYNHLLEHNLQLISVLIDQIPKDRQITVLESMDFLVTLLDHNNEDTWNLLDSCCNIEIDSLTPNCSSE